jgi:hypothetical protein
VNLIDLPELWRAKPLGEEAPYIIQTHYRDKHSKLLSYPVGAELLSRAFDRVPQLKSLTCRFTAKDPHLEKGSDDWHVMMVGYRRQSRSFHESKLFVSRGGLDPSWDIQIYSVLADHRAEIKKALVEIGLPNMVRPWLIENASLEGQIGEARINLHYDTSTKTLYSEVTNNMLPERT